MLTAHSFSLCFIHQMTASDEFQRNIQNGWYKMKIDLCICIFICIWWQPFKEGGGENIGMKTRIILYIHRQLFILLFMFSILCDKFICSLSFFLIFEQKETGLHVVNLVKLYKYLLIIFYISCALGSGIIVDKLRWIFFPLPAFC